MIEALLPAIKEGLLENTVKEKALSNIENNLKTDLRGQENTKYRLPVSDGRFAGEPGNSMWKPDETFVPKKHNPEGLPWKNILETNGVSGISYENGKPNFSPVARAAVKIDDFTANRDTNFSQADEKLATQWTKDNHDGKSWTPSEISKYRKDNDLSWHEWADMKTMELVPQKVHGNITHSGGISAYKKLHGI
ncbi:MAG: hypothetical protein HOC69_04240 [Candidatus Marinimicrobia bacterium]|jgi:hypothetical protein|nr:hypothetical protein [Candidatus Neomarinimicrobiota bacterium]